MKKIIISNKQLMEDISLAQTGKTSNIVNGVSDAAKSVLKNKLPMYVPNPNGGEKGKILNLTADTATGAVTSKDLNIIQNQNPEGVNVVSPATTSTTNTIVEKAYSKKHIEEVRKSNGRVMTKRELMESWGVAGNGTINDVYEIINNKKSEYQNKFQKAIGSLTPVEEEIKNAINDIKSNLEDLGINVTGMEVECNDDDFEILVKTDWVLKGDDYDENEEDYRKYKYLASVKGAEFSYYMAQQGYKTPYANQYSIVHFGLEDDKNPYFKIWGDIPDMNVEDNERY